MVVLLHVILLLIGFRRLREVDYYWDDPIDLHLMGLRNLPEGSIWSRAISQMDNRSIENVRCPFRGIVIEALQRENLQRLTPAFDGWVQSQIGYVEQHGC